MLLGKEASQGKKLGQLRNEFFANVWCNFVKLSLPKKSSHNLLKKENSMIIILVYWSFKNKEVKVYSVK